MGRAWLTGVTLAGVVGSGGAAVAGVAVMNDSVAPSASPSAIESAEAALPPLDDPDAPPATSVIPGSPVLTTYDVGGAGAVTIAAGPDSMVADGIVPGAGWTLLGTGGDQQHLEVQFADATMVVTFVADLVGGEVVVTTSASSLAPSAEPVEAAPPATPRPSTSHTTGATAVPTTARPAPTSPAAVPATASVPGSGSTVVPATTAAPAPAATAPAATAPPASATTAPSGSGEEKHDDEGDDDGGEEHDDD